MIEEHRLRPRDGRMAGGSRIPTMAAALMLMLLGVATPATAQTSDSPDSGGEIRWSLINAVGYGGLGFGVGLVATWDLEGSDFGPPGAALAVIGATTVAGTVAGAIIGRRARNAIARGRSLSGAHRAAVMGGVVMAGGTLGAVAAVPLINAEGEGTFLGSDERTVTLLVLAGGALGSVYVWKQRDRLAFRSVRLTPVLSGTRGYGFHIRVGL